MRTAVETVADWFRLVRWPEVDRDGSAYPCGRVDRISQHVAIPRVCTDPVNLRFTSVYQTLGLPDNDSALYLHVDHIGAFGPSPCILAVDVDGGCA